MHAHIYTRWNRFPAFFFIITLSAFLNLACKSESSASIVANDARPGATPAPAAAITPAASPSTPPASPVGPVGQTTPTGESGAQAAPQQGEIKTSINGLPVTVSPAKPTMTPAPDPFPPRPEPTIVMKDGKIVQTWQAPAEALSLVSPVKDKPDAAMIGKGFFMQRCADCHGKEGKGNGWMSKMVGKPPTNLGSKLVQANSDGELFWKITNGKSPMPANRARFTDEQRWYMVAYLRTLKP